MPTKCDICGRIGFFVAAHFLKSNLSRRTHRYDMTANSVCPECAEKLRKDLDYQEFLYVQP